MNDFQNRRLGAVEVQPRVRFERVAPRRRQEDDNEMIGGVPPRSNEILVAAVNELDRRVEMRDVPGGQIKDGGLDLETDAPGPRQVPQDRIETVARAGEWINHPDRATADNWHHD